MTQMTDEGGRQLEAAARSVAAKLQTFQDGLTAAEQQVLGFAFSEVAAARAEADLTGYSYINGIGEVRDWCLTWQWNGRWPMPLPTQPTRIT